MAGNRLERYQEFQRRQRENYRASLQPSWEREAAANAAKVPNTDQTPAAASPGIEVLAAAAAAVQAEAEAEVQSNQSAGVGGATALTSASIKPYGRAGRPLNRFSPVYLGFVGATGAILAFGLWSSLARLTTTITIVVVALFLALALEPIVRWLTTKGMKRGLAVGVVFLGVVVVFILLGLLVVPPVVSEGAQLIQNAPGYVNETLNSEVVQRLDDNYNVVERLRTEVNSRLTDSGFISQVFGGVLGAGMALVSSFFKAFTVLILTLYFLAALPGMKQAVYMMVPASRRARVEPLAEEIMRRTGAYAIGQVTVATINAVCSYLMMRLLSVPYAAVLAVAVGFLGLIPMVGATIGAILVGLVALFHDPTSAVIVAIYYVVYQQIENYVIAPKIMARTVSVPGAVTVVAALAGGTLLGVLGALLAIPVAAGLLLLYEEVLLPRQARV